MSAPKVNVCAPWFQATSSPTPNLFWAMASETNWLLANPADGKKSGRTDASSIAARVEVQRIRSGEAMCYSRMRIHTCE